MLLPTCREKCSNASSAGPQQQLDRTWGRQPRRSSLACARSSWASAASNCSSLRSTSCAAQNSIFSTFRSTILSFLHFLSLICVFFWFKYIFPQGYHVLSFDHLKQARIHFGRSVWGIGNAPGAPLQAPRPSSRPQTAAQTCAPPAPRRPAAHRCAAHCAPRPTWTLRRVSGCCKWRRLRHCAAFRRARCRADRSRILGLLRHWWPRRRWSAGKHDVHIWY